jgi:hypothetical protein
MGAVLLAACSSPKVSDSLYRDSEVGSSKDIVRCRVLEVREVAIREDDAPEKGEAVGAILQRPAWSPAWSRAGRAAARPPTS